jgi:putative oxidoreductase
LGHTLQRLFSTFPNSWPGFGLLLIRICLFLSLLHFRITLAEAPSDAVTFAQKSVVLAGSVLLLIGLWTPVVAVVIALNELSAAFLFSPQRKETWVHVFFAVLSASIAMLGPGAWSIDARLFGRKRIDIDRKRGRTRLP